MAASRRAERLQQGSGAIFSLGTACALLPLDDGEARGWLRERGLVRHLLGRPVVVWADVQDALRADPGRAESNPPPLSKAYRRRRLKPLT